MQALAAWLGCLATCNLVLGNIICYIPSGELVIFSSYINDTSSGWIQCRLRSRSPLFVVSTCLHVIYLADWHRNCWDFHTFISGILHMGVVGGLTEN